MKRFHFQVNSRVIYDVVEVEANSLEEATEKLRWHKAQNGDHEKYVKFGVNEPFEELNAFLGINAV